MLFQRIQNLYFLQREEKQMDKNKLCSKSIETEAVLTKTEMNYE